MKRNILTFTVLILSLLSLSCSDEIKKGKTFEEHSQKLNNNYLLVVTAYHEEGGFGPVAGAFYVFKVLNNKDNSAREILEFRHDDPVEIPKENIKAIDKNLAYFWMGWKFASTTDGGKTWNTWDARDFEEYDINYGFIKDVEIEKDGKGKMYFNDFAKERAEISEFVTSDFGKTWEKP